MAAWLNVFLNEASAVETNSTSEVKKKETKVESTARTHGQVDTTEDETVVDQNEISGDELTLSEDVALTTADIDLEASSVKTVSEILEILRSSKQVDSFVTLKSKFSEEAHFNSLKTPNLEAKFVYNHFDDEEESKLKENPKEDLLVKNKLNDVPMYIKLNWNTAFIENKISYAETDSEKKKEFFEQDRGVATNASAPFNNSFNSSRARSSKINEEDTSFELIDSHKLDSAFDNTSNNSVFRNMTVASLNVDDDDEDDEGSNENIVENFILQQVDKKI